MNDKTVSSNENEHHLDEGEQEGLPTWLEVALIAVACAAIGILILYFLNFNSGWGTQETFAQFGDFIGGTLNPILGFATVALLIWSIRLQMKELRLTREELAATKEEAKKSREALDQQVLHLERESKLSELNRMISQQKKIYENLLGKPLVDQTFFYILVKGMNRLPLKYEPILIRDIIYQNHNGEKLSSFKLKRVLVYLDEVNQGSLEFLQFHELKVVATNIAGLILRFVSESNDELIKGISLFDAYMLVSSLNVFMRSEDLMDILQIIDEQPATFIRK